MEKTSRKSISGIYRNHTGIVIAGMLVILAFVLVGTADAFHFPGLEAIGEFVLYVVIYYFFFKFVAWCIRLMRKVTRKNDYKQIIGDYKETPLDMLAGKTGATRKQVVQELTKMADKGEIPAGEIDTRKQAWISPQSSEKRKDYTIEWNDHIRLADYSDANQQYCEECGAPIEPEASFCVLCGVEISWDAKAAAENPYLVYDNETSYDRESMLKAIHSLNDKELVKSLKKIDSVAVKIDKKLEGAMASDIMGAEKLFEMYMPKIIEVIENYQALLDAGESESRTAEMRENLVILLEDVEKSAKKILRKAIDNDIIDVSSELDALRKMLTLDGYQDESK